MKKIILLTLFVIILSSCRTPFYLGSSALDYSKYSNQGFFISESNSVSFDYKPIASVVAEFQTGYEPLIRNGKAVVWENEWGMKVPKTTKKLIPATREGVTEELYKKAVQIGANGIINFEISTIRVYTKETGYITTGYVATGMAIKK